MQTIAHWMHKFASSTACGCRLGWCLPGHDDDGQTARQADTAEPASAVRAIAPAGKASDRGGDQGGLTRGHGRRT
eukprot:scaffold62550_cov60-Phaeocystis_antarctica.AAC.4